MTLRTSKKRFVSKRLNGMQSSALQTVMVPLDGSVFAERALPLATDIARRAGARLQIVHVSSMVRDHGWRNHLIPDRGLCDVQIDLRSRASSYLEHLVEKLQRESAVRVASRTVVNRDVVHALRDAASGADLVIMAAHGKGMIRRWTHASTIRQLLGKLSSSAIVVGGDGSLSPPPPQRLRRIVIALDGSRQAERTLGPACGLADLTNAEIILLRAIPMARAFGALTYRSGTGEWHNTPGRMQLAAAGRYLRRLSHRIRQRANVVDSRVVLSHKSIARTVAATAEALNADLVALATCEKTIDRQYPRLAERLIQFASMPVMVVPSDAPSRRWRHHNKQS
jgi:nucleotide-binding universal stress UspA family protein